MDKLIAGLFIILSTSLYGQDEIAKELLDGLSETSKSHNNISLEFILTIENKSQDISIIQVGNLVLSKEKFQLTMDNQTIINNGKIQWIYLPEINEVQIMENDPKNMMSPNKLFNIYEEEYKYNYVGSNFKEGKHLEFIDLFPKESQEFMKINIAVDIAKNQLDRITIHDKNGGKYKYVITSYKTNTVLKPFVFDSTDFPDVEVIDLR